MPLGLVPALCVTHSGERGVKGNLGLGATAGSLSTCSRVGPDQVSAGELPPMTDGDRGSPPETHGSAPPSMGTVIPFCLVWPSLVVHPSLVISEALSQPSSAPSSERTPFWTFCIFWWSHCPLTWSRNRGITRGLIPALKVSQGPESQDSICSVWGTSPRPRGVPRPCQPCSQPPGTPRV